MKITNNAPAIALKVSHLIQIDEYTFKIPSGIVSNIIVRNGQILQTGYTQNGQIITTPYPFGEGETFFCLHL